MESNRDLDLHLSPSSTTSPSSDVCHHNLSGGDPQTVNDQQEITIFYNGRVCTFDLTEIQARAIILMASRKKGCNTSYKARGLGAVIPVKEGARSHSPRCLSMMKSLRRFLEDRKRRTKAAALLHTASNQ